MNSEEGFKETEIGLIPEDWEMTSLKTLGTLKNGVNFNRDDFGKGYPIINVKNLYSGRYATINHLNEIKIKTIKNPNDYELRPGDLLFARSSVKASGAGQVAMVNKLPENKTLFSGFIIRFRPDSIDINPAFLNYQLRSPIFRNYLTAIATGTTITNLTQSILSDIPIIIPSINEQKAMSSFLSAIDNKIELNYEINRTMEAMGQAIFRHWFVHFEFPDSEGRPYKSSGGEMVDSELGEIPKGWEVGKLGDLVDNIKNSLNPGKHLKNRKYVPIDCLSMKKLNITEFLDYSEAKSSLIAFEKGDILLGAMRVYFHRVNMAPFSGITRTTTFVLRPKEKHFLAYSIFLLNQEYTIDYANSHSKGTTMPYAVWNNSLADMPILIPTEFLIKKFNDILSPLLLKINKSFFVNLNLKELRDTLLPKLMSGKIRVKTQEEATVK